MHAFAKTSGTIVATKIQHMSTSVDLPKRGQIREQAANGCTLLESAVCVRCRAQGAPKVEKTGQFFGKIAPKKGLLGALGPSGKESKAQSPD